MVEQVEINAGNEAVFEFGIGEAVLLSGQDSFEHRQQGIGGTTLVILEVTVSLTIGIVRSAANQLPALTSIEGSD